MIAVTATQIAELDSAILKPLLHTAELTEAAMMGQQRQQQFLAGRAVLRWLAAQVLQVPLTQVQIVRQANGAPQLFVEDKQWCCSISHTSTMVAASFGDAASLGIDIEAQTRIIPERVVRRFQQGMFAAADNAEYIHRWTLAEAVTKAEQGLLLTTLKRKCGDYQADVAYFSVAGHCICCYSPNLSASPDWIDFDMKAHLS